MQSRNSAPAPPSGKPPAHKPPPVPGRGPSNQSVSQLDLSSLSAPPAHSQPVPSFEDPTYIDPDNPQFMIKNLDDPKQTIRVDQYQPAAMIDHPLAVEAARRGLTVFRLTPKELAQIREDERKKQEAADKEYQKIKDKMKPAERAALQRLVFLPPCLTKVKLKLRKKTDKEFKGLCLVQTLNFHNDAIWTARFSVCGQYLATGGKDGVLRVFQVRQDLANPQLYQNMPIISDNGTSLPLPPPPSLSASSSLAAGTPPVCTPLPPIPPITLDDFPADPEAYNVFESTPFRELREHESQILDVAWAPNGFLLSGSMDATVKLWHISRQQSLRTLQHGDFVTCVDFNPVDNGYCVSGCLDRKVRIWNVREARAVYRADLGDYVTAVRFSPDGTMVFAGTFTGKCFILAAVGLPLITRLEIRSKHGANHDKKVTGIDFPPSADRFIVTTNDSRVRCYALSNFEPICKYMGMANQNSQIRATYSPSGRYVAAGSESSSCIVWDAQYLLSNGESGPGQSGFKGKNEHVESYQFFTAHDSICTTAVFAPTGFAGALVPAPHNGTGSGEKSGRLSRTPTSPSTPQPAQNANMPPVYPDLEGQVIVTTSQTGEIKVWRNFTPRYSQLWVYAYKHQQLQMKREQEEAEQTQMQQREQQRAEEEERQNEQQGQPAQEMQKEEEERHTEQSADLKEEEEEEKDEAAKEEEEKEGGGEEETNVAQPKDNTEEEKPEESNGAATEEQKEAEEEAKEEENTEEQEGENEGEKAEEEDSDEDEHTGVNGANMAADGDKDTSDT